MRGVNSFNFNIESKVFYTSILLQISKIDDFCRESPPIIGYQGYRRQRGCAFQLSDCVIRYFTVL